MSYRTISVIGRGRMGTALAAALGAPTPLGRHSDGGGADVVLLCVPDAEIAAAAADVAPGRLVGHCSGATTLAPLAPDPTAFGRPPSADRGGCREAFSLHPLTTVLADPAAPVDFAGVTFAIAGSTPRALDVARDLTQRLGGRPIVVDDDDRAAYHAAASIASNFVVTLLSAAERMVVSSGVDRDALVPLVRAAVDNWAGAGDAALTGPIARGDEQTVAAQRAAVAERAPELLELYDALADATAAVAGRPLASA